MVPDINKVRNKLNAILAKYGITDKREQQKIIIEIINAFIGR
jgi:hypothetical protein